MRRLTLPAVLVAFVAIVLTHATASADPVVEDQRLEAPSKLTVGDHLRLVVKLTADSGTTVTLAPGALNDPFVLTKQPSTTTRSAGAGRVEIDLTLEMAVFATGDLQLPSLRLQFKERSGNSGEVITRPTSVSVRSVLPQDPSGVVPRDLKPQAELAQPGGLQALAPVAVAVALLVLAAVVVFVLRRRARPRAEAVPDEAEEADMAPEDAARRRLDAAAAAFARDRDYVAYYTALATTLREYLTARFGFPAFALTTTELQEQMVRRGMDRWQARIAGGLLNQCDGVVYARYRPAAERADIDLTAAYEIVEMSRAGQLPAEEETMLV